MEKSKDLVPTEQEDNAFAVLEDNTASQAVTTTPEIKTAGPVTTADEERAGGLSGADAGSNTSLGRPIAPRPRTRPPTRRKRNPWGWVVVVLLAAAAGAGAFFYVRSTQVNPAFLGQTIQATNRQPVSVAVSSNGQVQANADLSLNFGSAGTLTKLYKKPGDTVKAGDPLAQIDTKDLDFALKSAQASYDQQQASYKKTIEGATQKELEQAQAQVDQSRANLETTKNGSFTDQDVQSANAQINSAAAKLAQTRGGPTGADLSAAQASINSASAQLNSAQAKLAQTLQGGSPQEKASAQSAVSSAEAQLASAKAKLEKTLAGPDFATLSSAQSTYDQAVANYNRTVSQLQLSVAQSQVARDQALNALKNAQDSYNSIYKENRDSSGKLKDGLKDSQITRETQALRTLQDAQGNYNKSDLALNDAKNALTYQTRSLQSQVDNSKTQLEKVKAGALPSEISADQASVASAQASLDSAKKNLIALQPTQAQIAADQASVASAQASLESGQKTLAALYPTQAQLASDEASLANAQSTLAKLRGGTPEQVAASEAQVTSAQATLNDLLRGTKPNDLAIAKAQLDVAQTNLDKAKAALDSAVLKSPIAGTVVKADLTEGQSITASSVVYQIVDLSSLRVDVNIGESDVAKIKEGMPVAVNLDAISGRSFSGKVSFISSKSTVTSNVVGYQVTITLDKGQANSLLETYQAEFAKLVQRPGGQGAPGGQAPPGGQGAPGGFQLPGNAPRGAAAQLTAATGVCGYSLLGLVNRGGDQPTPKAGMTANVTFCLNLKAGVLSVPNRAIKTKTEGGQRISYVEVLVDRATNKIEQRPVSVGLAGDNYTEINGGNLKDGDQIVLSTTPTNRNTTGGGAGPGGGGGNFVIR